MSHVCLLSTGHLLRILIPLEEPPHLTADIYDRRNMNEICLVFPISKFDLNLKTMKCLGYETNIRVISIPRL